uniref:uncharacterized protein LOC125417580 n=1 Tax=Myodes glareolus TaxID=447135 RepID=UPI0020209BAD|nr:uncharacterized protein LOC125417580 [Myodes glareolus]
MRSERLTLRQNQHGVSVEEISGSSQSSYSRATRELEETEEEESCDWTCPMETGKMGDFAINNQLEKSTTLSPSSKTYSHVTDDSSLSSAAGLDLRDCAPEKVCQDWDPEVLLAADILASRTSWSNFIKEFTTTSYPSKINPVSHQENVVSTTFANCRNNSKRSLRVQLPESNSAIQMENFLSLLESVDPSWLTPSSTTWAMDMIVAFVCGLGLFCLLLPLLPLDSPSPAPAGNTNPQKSTCITVDIYGRKVHSVRVLPYSSCPNSWPHEILAAIISPAFYSIQERLANTISICSQLGQDASGEAFKPDAAKAHLPPRQPTGESEETHSSLETSSASCNEHLLLKDSKPLSPVMLNSSPMESQSSESASWPPETLTTGRHLSQSQQRVSSYPSDPLDPVACSPPMTDPSAATLHVERKMLETSQRPTLPGLPSPIPTTAGINLSRRPTSTIPDLNYSSRSTSISLNQEHLSRPTSSTPGVGHLDRPTSSSPGLEHSSRPISGPFRYQLTSRTVCHSTSAPDEALKEDLALTIDKASFWKGPKDSHLEAVEPTLISPVIHEIQQDHIRKRVQQKHCKGETKGRSDLSTIGMVNKLDSCSSKEGNVTSCPFWMDPTHKRVLANGLQEKCVQLYWGLPCLHSESLVAPVSMADSPLDLAFILFNGLSTYSPSHVKNKGHPQLCSPEPLLQHLVKSQPLSSKISWSRTPSETRIQGKAHDASSLSKLPCNSSPVKKDGASCLTSSRAQFIVSPRARNLEHHLIKKQGEISSDLPVSDKKSQEAANQNTIKGWDSLGQEPVVHNQGDYISPEFREKTEEHFKKRRTQHQFQWPPKVQLSLDLGQAEVNHRISCPSSQANESGESLQSVSAKGPEMLQPWQTTLRDLPKYLERALEQDLPPEGSQGRGLKTINTLNLKTATSLPYPQSSKASLSWESTYDSMIETASILGHPIQQAPEGDMKIKASSMESQYTQNSPSVLQPATLREVPPCNNSVSSEAPTTAQRYNDTNLSTPQCLVGRIWHRERVDRSMAENPEPNQCQLHGIWKTLESERFTLRENQHGVSVEEISSSSQSSYSTAIRELEETEEEESCDWTHPMETGKMGDFAINNQLEKSTTLSPSSKTYSHVTDDSSLSSAAGLVLRDCAPEKVCQDWDPEVLLAADILASRTSWSNFIKEFTTHKLPVQNKSRFSSRGRSFHHICKLQEQQQYQSFVTNMQKDKYRSPPTQDTKLHGTKPVQGHPSNDETFGDKIKKVIFSTFTPNCNIQEKSRPNCQSFPSFTQGPLTGPSLPQKARSKPVYEPKINPKSVGTVYHAGIKSQPSFDTGIPYVKEQVQATRDPVSRASSCYKSAHMQHAPGIPVSCPRHRHCIKV